MMKIALASDHGGFALKEALKKHLAQRGFAVTDLGAFSDAPADYPLYGRRCAEAVAAKEADRGIVCCGSGIGISIAANKVQGIRCALCTSTRMAELARRHNDANMLALGGRILDTQEAIAITDVWLDTAFEDEQRADGRHRHRVDALNAMSCGGAIQ